MVSSHPVAAVPMAEDVGKEGLCQVILAKPVFSKSFFFLMFIELKTFDTGGLNPFKGNLSLFTTSLLM